MAIKGRIPIEFGTVFPGGAYAAGPVEKVRDFERSRKDEVIQQLDKDSGLPLWVVEVIDAQEDARQRTVKVKIILPEQIEAGHVDFARQLAAKAWTYAVAVERRYRGLPSLPDIPVPYALTAKAEALLNAEPDRADLMPLPGGREVTA